MRNWCPKCKSSDVGMHHTFYGHGKHEWIVECYNCNHKGKIAPTFDEAVKNWDEEKEKS